jgi:hypothetical protein
LGPGSGQYYYRPPEKSIQLFKDATTELKESETRTRNVFISFHNADESQVELLRSQARNESNELAFRDYSVKEPFDEKWKTNCRARIALTSATICMIGPETANREAVIWELEEAYRQGHLVIGVRIYSDRNDPVPKPLLDHNAPVIPWKLDEINNLLKLKD